MFRVEFIGNLGADAEVRQVNGKEFVSFRLADNERRTDSNTGQVTETTTWASCMMNKRDGLLPYLRKGARLFVRGRADLRIYSSKTARGMVAGLDIFIDELELCGSTEQDRQIRESYYGIVDFLQSRGYKEPADMEKIPTLNPENHG